MNSGDALKLAGTDDEGATVGSRRGQDNRSRLPCTLNNYCFAAHELKRCSN